MSFFGQARAINLQRVGRTRNVNKLVDSLHSIFNTPTICDCFFFFLFLIFGMFLAILLDIFFLRFFFVYSIHFNFLVLYGSTG